jgi:hypothetical protein
MRTVDRAAVKPMGFASIDRGEARRWDARSGSGLVQEPTRSLSNKYG